MEVQSVEVHILEQTITIGKGFLDRVPGHDYDYLDYCIPERFCSLNFQHLSIYGCAIDNIDMVLNMKSLTKICFRNCKKITQDFLRRLPELPFLDQLAIKGCNITKLPDEFSDMRLTMLVVDNNKLKTLPNMSGVRFLSCSGNEGIYINKSFNDSVFMPGGQDKKGFVHKTQKRTFIRAEKVDHNFCLFKTLKDISHIVEVDVKKKTAILLLIMKRLLIESRASKMIIELMMLE